MCPGVSGVHRGQFDHEKWIMETADAFMLRLYAVGAKSFQIKNAFPLLSKLKCSNLDFHFI